MISVFGVVMGYGGGEKRLVKAKPANFIICANCHKKIYLAPSRLAKQKFCNPACREVAKRRRV